MYVIKINKKRKQTQERFFYCCVDGKFSLELEKRRMKRNEMKRILTFMIILVALTACSTPQIQVVTNQPATDIPQVGIPNPASVYCKQNGYKIEIHTAADGSQSGVCVFPDGSTCDEWAYLKGECDFTSQKSPTPLISDETVQKANDYNSAGENASGGYIQPETTEKISGWWGVVKSTPPGSQYDDYFKRQDLGGAILF
jgi:putative hemolysin